VQFIQDFLYLFVRAPGGPRDEVSELIGDNYLGRTSDAPVRPKLNHARHGQGTLDSPFRPLQIDFYFVWVYVPFQYRRSFVDTTDSVLAGDEAPCVYNLEVALPEAVRMLPL